MNQRLVWNFEFTSKKKLLPLATVGANQEHDTLKWESRFFWPDNKAIQLHLIDTSLLDLTNYQHKSKQDYYYLSPNHNYNIKRRRDQLLYKPLIKQISQYYGFGPKIILKELDNTAEQPILSPYLQEIAQIIEQESREIPVKKESFVYKLPTTPKIKIEFARLEVFNRIFFSLCVEGKSMHLVETVSKHLLDKQVSCDYVTFLKNILNL